MSLTASSASWVLPSFTPKTLPLCKSNSLLSLPLLGSSSIKLSAKCSLLSAPFLQSSRLSARKVASHCFAVSSEFEQGEDAVGDGEQGSLSSDLKLYVGNLPFSVDSATLAGLFQQVGNVELVEVIFDKITGKSRGFAFVTMSSFEEVEAAAQRFNGYEFEGRTLKVNFGPQPPRTADPYSRGARGGNGFGDSNRVHVGNLSWTVDDSALQSFFGGHGKVMEAKVICDRDSGRSRGFGFVTYSSAEEVTSAVRSLNGMELEGRNIRVSVAEGRQRRQF